jgi:hypothetical protein
VEEGSYIIEDERVVVLNREEPTIFSLTSQKCSCIAFSHHQVCVCSLLIAHLNIEARESSQVQEAPPSPAIKEEVLSLEVIVKDILQGVRDDKICPAVEASLRKLHSQIFRSFPKVRQPKRIRPLHPYRKAIAQSKTDHPYHRTNRRGSGVKRKTPNDFKAATTSQTVKKKYRAKAAPSLYTKN